MALAPPPRSTKLNPIVAVHKLMQRRVPTLTSPPTQRYDLRKQLQPGDVVLVCDDSRPLTHPLIAALGSAYTHVAMYAGNDRLVHADHFGVRERPVELELGGRMKLAVVRPPYADAEAKADALSYLTSNIGAKYDWKFDVGNDTSMYCTELAYWALRAGGIDMKPRKILKWEAVLPDDFKNLPGAKLAIDDRHTYWKGVLSRSPMHAGTVGGAALGYWKWKLKGAVLGAVLGHELALQVGNRLQGKDVRGEEEEAPPAPPAPEEGQTPAP